MKNIWLGKLDPKNHSIDDIEKRKRDTWKRVRHPKAMQHMAEVKKGDMILVYHSGEKEIKGVVGVLANNPDPDHPRGRLIEVEFQRKFSEPFVSLAMIKVSNNFADFGLVREPRLSFMPVPDKLLKDFNIKV